MKTKVTALTSFMHGRVHAQYGDQIELSKADADALAAEGLVQLAAEETPMSAAQADEGVDDLLGGDQKMDAAPENKMEADPDNKGKAKTNVKK